MTLFFSNANIDTPEEFDRRLAALRTLAEGEGATVLVDPPDHAQWFREVAAGFSACPEKGARCARCFRYSLRRAAEAAQKGGFDGFCTSLTVSPLKRSAQLLAIGAETDPARFKPYDFKKKNGYQESIRIAAEYHLYRQNYCGCEFSKADRERKTTQPPVFLLAGATATGKSAVAQCLAERFRASILSADSMLVYQGMDIGTAKPSLAERGEIPYAGIDLVTPGEPFSAGKWLEAAHIALRESPKHRIWIVAGGTGLYFKALLENLQPAASDPVLRASFEKRMEEEGVDAFRAWLASTWPNEGEKIADPMNPRRLIRAAEILSTEGTLPVRTPCDTPLPALFIPREVLRKRIQQRVDRMFEEGLEAEVRMLRQRYPQWSATAGGAIGYAEVAAWLDGTLSFAEARERIIIRTNQLAKRQETWLRHQANVVWIETDPTETVESIADRVDAVWRKYGPAPIPL